MVTRDFNIVNGRATTRQTPEKDLLSLEDFHGIHLSEKTKNAQLFLRNCVYPPLGKHILDCAINSPSLFAAEEIKSIPLF